MANTAQTAGRAGKTEFRCHVCVANGLKCDGRALPGFRVERLPVCKVGATHHFNHEREHNFAKIARLGKKAEGPTKKAIGQILNRMRVEVAEIFTGAADPGGTGSIVQALDRIADLLADARFTLASAIYQRAKQAAEEHLDKLEQSKRDAVQNVLDTAASHLELMDVNPLELDFRPRRARWSAAKDALNLVQGLPTTIGKLSGVSAHQFRTKILSQVLGVSPDEAARMIKELGEARSEKGAEVEEKAAVPEPEVVEAEQAEATAEAPPAEVGALAPAPLTPKSGNGRRRSRKVSSTKAEKAEADATAAPNGEEKRKRQRRRRAASPVEEGEE